MKKYLLAAVLIFALAGCANQSSNPTPSPDPTKTKTQTEIDTEFLKIAYDSCAKAQNENIVESMDDGSKTIVLAKKNAYKDYSAVYLDAAGKAQVIYEMELLVCQPGYLISMMKEANHDNSGDYEHHVKLNQDGTYTWSQHAYGTDNQFDETTFVVSNGIITAGSTKDYNYTFLYGDISDSDMQVFKKAIDDELIRLNQ